MAVAVCAVVLGQRDLLRIGIFLLALPGVALAVVSRTRYRLACSRRIEPARVAAGAEATVVLRLDNVSRLPTGVLLVEDGVPYNLGIRPRFVLDRVEPRGVREVSYPVRSDVRGRFPIGPLSVRLTDPFGLVELVRAFATVDPLVVTPRVTPLPHVRLGGDWAGGGESRARSVSSAGEDDIATREYRHGDDLRRVHWRSTARYGELMVRREEQPWQSRGALLLDNRVGAHRGEGPGSSFEWSVSAIASIGVQLSRNGYALRLVSADAGDGTEHVQGAGGAIEGLLLDSLAELKPVRTPSLGPAVQELRRSGGNGLIVAVLGTVGPQDTSALARVRSGATTGIAVLLDTASWAGMNPRARDEAAAAYVANARLLQASGWRVIPVRHGSDLATAWPQAAASGPEPLLTAAGTGPGSEATGSHVMGSRVMGSRVMTAGAPPRTRTDRTGGPR